MQCIVFNNNKKEQAKMSILCVQKYVQKVRWLKIAIFNHTYVANHMKRCY